jgi:hypothetical protein
MANRLRGSARRLSNSMSREARLQNDKLAAYAEKHKSAVQTNSVDKHRFVVVNHKSQDLAFTEITALAKSLPLLVITIHLDGWSMVESKQ